MRRRPAAALVTTLVLLGGCAAGPEAPDAPASEPSTAASDDSLTVGTGADDDEPEPVFHRRIQPALRSTFTPPTSAQWRTEPVEVVTNDGPARLSIPERRMPPCGPGGLWVSYEADADVLDFAQTVRREGRFTAVQHMTLYPDADAARALLVQLDGYAECARIDGSLVMRTGRNGYARDRTLRTLRPRATRVSEADLRLADGRTVTMIDTVVRRGNAVVMTRVVDPEPTEPDPMLAEDLRGVARAATDDAWGLLDRLLPEPAETARD